MWLTTFVEKGCLGLEFFECKPGKITMIKGAKAKGKTSVLETLGTFFTNKGERPDFINSNSDKGEVVLTFDNGMTAKKIYHSAGGAPYVNIDDNGMRPNMPEKYLKGLISDEQINPISFISKSEKEQTEEILKAIPMKLKPDQVTAIWGEIPEKIDTSKHALKVCKDIETYYLEKRRDVNAEVKALDANITDLKAKLPDGYDAEKWRDAKATDVMTEINEATENNKHVTACQNLIAQAEDQKKSIQTIAKAQAATKQAKIDDLAAQVKKLKEEKAAITGKTTTDCATVDEKVRKATQWLAENEEILIQPLQDKAEEIEIMKGFILSADDLVCKNVEIEKKKKEADTLTHNINLARSEPAKLLKEAEMPIEGLGIDEDGNVRINGRPVANLSGGERIEVALKIAKATSGPLKLILINGFEALDKESQDAFIAKIKEDEYQYIITCVASGELTVTDES